MPPLNENQNQATMPPASKASKKPWILGIVIVIIVGSAAIGTWLYWQSTQTNRTNTEAARISITRGGFIPETLRVSKGAVVQWLNNDSAAHRVVGDTDNSGIDTTENLAQGDDYQLRFDQPGTYHYHDPLDPNTFKGTVVVQ